MSRFQEAYLTVAFEEYRAQVAILEDGISLDVFNDKDEVVVTTYRMYDELPVNVKNSNNEPRLFWVVDSRELNREIFATKEEAEDFAESNFGTHLPYSILISEVRNYYQENNEAFNYDDFAETFNDIITIVRNTPPVKELSK